MLQKIVLKYDIFIKGYINLISKITFLFIRPLCNYYMPLNMLCF